MKKKSLKMDRVNEEVYRAISDIIRNDVKDPRISPITSVTACDVTKDLKQAKVYISVFGEDEDLEGTIEGLKSSAGFIRSCLARELNLRNTPELNFIADSSIAYGMRMSKMIDDVIANDNSHNED